MDYGTIVAIMGQEAMKHPSVVSMGTQLGNLWNANQAEFMQAVNQYNEAAAKVTDMVSRIGVLFEVMRAHPKLSGQVIQALGIAYPHVPETQTALAELQAAVNAAPTS